MNKGNATPTQLFQSGVEYLNKEDFKTAKEFFHEAAFASMDKNNQKDMLYATFKEAECDYRDGKYVAANNRFQHQASLFPKIYGENTIEFAEFLFLYGENCMCMGFEAKGFALKDSSINLLRTIPSENANKLLQRFSNQREMEGSLDAINSVYRNLEPSKEMTWFPLRKFLWWNKPVVVNSFLKILIVASLAIGWAGNESLNNLMGKVLFWSFLGFIGYLLGIIFLMYTTKLVPGSEIRSSIFRNENPSQISKAKKKSREIKSDAVGNFLFKKSFTLMVIAVIGLILFFTGNKAVHEAINNFWTLFKG